MLPSRGTLTEWRNVLTEVSSSLVSKKFKILHLRSSNPLIYARDRWTGKQIYIKGPGVHLFWWTPSWIWANQCAFAEKKAESISWAALSVVLAASWEVILPSDWPWWGHSGSTMSSSGLCSTRVTWTYWNATVRMKGLEHFSYKEKPRELGLFNLENRIGCMFFHSSG